MSQKIVQFKKFDDEKRIVYAEVYIPMVPDSQGDFASYEEVERMAHNFLRNGYVNKVDVEHNLKECGAQVVESFIARAGDPDFIEGAWVVGAHIPSDSEWAKVKKGEINGFSMWGSGVRQEKVLEIELPDDGGVSGSTLAEQDHTHKFLVKFDADGTFLGGETNEVNGHKHTISKGTATDANDGHSHRYALMDAIMKSYPMKKKKGMAGAC